MAKGMNKRRDEKKPKKETPKVIAAAPSTKNGEWPHYNADLDPLVTTLQSWGLRPDVGAHVVDRHEYRKINQAVIDAASGVELFAYTSIFGAADSPLR